MHLAVSVPARRSTPCRSIVVGTQPSVSGIRAYVHDMQPASTILLIAKTRRPFLDRQPFALLMALRDAFSIPAAGGEKLNAVVVDRGCPSTSVMAPK